MITKGVILGRFMPPHQGHVSLVQTASHLVDRLTIILATSDADDIAPAQRKAWMEALFPTASIIPCQTGPIPLPFDDPRWTALIRGFHPEPIDRVIGSEAYVKPLAQSLDAQHFILDPMWMAHPADSAAIRNDPNAHWEALPGPVRPWFQQRVTMVGPESTGKSYLAAYLAEEFGGPYVPEYGRPYEKFRDPGDYRAEELHFIIDGHVAHRDTLAMQAGPILFEDTDPLLTCVWAEMLLGTCPPNLEARIELPDHYLLLDPDVPWEDDPIRYFARKDLRQKFFDLTKAKLEAHGASYALLTGSYEDRQRQAFELVQMLMNNPKRTPQ